MPINPANSVKLTIRFCLVNYLVRGHRPTNGAFRDRSGFLVIPDTPTLRRYVRAVRQLNRLAELVRLANERHVRIPDAVMFPRAWSRRPV